MTKAKDYNAVDWNSMVYYDETSPSCLRWKINKKYTRIQQGDSVGYKHTLGYYVTEHDSSPYLLHRVVWIVKCGYLGESLVVDHLDGNSLNNRVDNLRAVPQAINTRNQSIRKDNSSGATMVSYSVNSANHPYWLARWYNYTTGKLCAKSFSILRLGNEVAKQLATEYRNKMVTEQNLNGAGYSERHGT